MWVLHLKTFFCRPRKCNRTRYSVLVEWGKVKVKMQWRNAKNPREHLMIIPEMSFLCFSKKKEEIKYLTDTRAENNMSNIQQSFDNCTRN